MTPPREVKLAGIDMNLLVVLEALLTERNVTRAALRLNKSQPSLSNGLSRLRHMFNDPLLEREGNGMRLTPKARLLEPRVREVLDGARALLARGDGFDPQVGKFRVRICSADNVSFYFVPKMSRHLRDCGVEAEMTVDWPTTKVDALKRLARGKFDILLGTYLEAGDEVERFYLYEEPIVCLVRRDHPALEGMAPGADRVEVDNLSPYPCINIAYNGVAGRHLDAALERHGLDAKRVRSTHQLIMTPYYMLGDDTVAFTSRRMGVWLSSMLPLRVLDVGFDLPRFPMEMLVDRSRLNEGWMRWFIDHVMLTVPDEREDVLA